MVYISIEYACNSSGGYMSRSLFFGHRLKACLGRQCIKPGFRFGASAALALTLIACVQNAVAQTNLRVVAVFMDDYNYQTGGRIGREVLAPKEFGYGGAPNCEIHVMIQNPTPNSSIQGTVTLTADDHTGCTNPLPEAVVSKTARFSYGVTDVTTPVTALGISPDQFPSANFSPLNLAGVNYSFSSRIFDLTASVSPADPAYASDTTRINMDGLGVPDWLWNMTEALYSQTTAGICTVQNPFEELPIWSQPQQVQKDLSVLGPEGLGFNTFLVGSYYSLNQAGVDIKGNVTGFNNMMGAPGGYSFPSQSYSAPDILHYTAGDVTGLVQTIHSMAGGPRVLAYTDPGVLSSTVTSTSVPYNSSMAATLSTGPNPGPVPFRAIETVNVASLWESLFDENELLLSPKTESTKESDFLNSTDEPISSDPNFSSDAEYARFYSTVADFDQSFDRSLNLAGVFSPPRRYLSEVAGYFPNFGPAYVSAAANDVSAATNAYNFDGVLADDIGRELEDYDLPIAQTNDLYALIRLNADGSNLLNDILAYLGLGPWPVNLPAPSDTWPYSTSIDFDDFGLTDPSWSSNISRADSPVDWVSISEMCQKLRAGITAARDDRVLLSSDYFNVWGSWPAQALSTDMPSSDHYPLFSRKWAEMAFGARQLTRKPFHTDNVQTKTFLESPDRVLAGWTLANPGHARAVEMALALAQGANMENDGEALIDPDNANGKGTGENNADTHAAVRNINFLVAHNPQLFDTPQGSLNSSPKELCYLSDPAVYSQIPLSQRTVLSITGQSNTGSGLGYGLGRIVSTIYRQTLDSGYRAYVMFLINTNPCTPVVSGPAIFNFTVTMPRTDSYMNEVTFQAPVVDSSGMPNGKLLSLNGNGNVITGQVQVGSVVILEWTSQLGPYNSAVQFNETLQSTPWPKGQGNLRNTCQGIGSGANGTPGWAFQTGGPVTQSPVIGKDGRIYFGSWDDNIYSIDPKNPTQNPYVVPTGSNTNGSPSVGLDGTVYVGNNSGQVWAVKGRSAEVFYQAGGLVNRVAVGPDGLVYIVGRDDQMHVVDPVSKEERWHFVGTGYANGVAFGQNGMVYVTTLDGKLSAVSPPSEVETAADPSVEATWVYQAGGPVYGTPSIGPDGSLYFGCNDNKIYGVLPSGETKPGWPVVTGNITGNIAISAKDYTIYAGSNDQNLYALRSDGTVKWTFKTSASGGVSCDGIAADGTIYVDAWGDKMYALDPDTGLQEWTFNAGDSVGAFALNSDGTIYLGSYDGHLYSIAGGYKATASWPVVSNPYGIRTDGHYFYIASYDNAGNNIGSLNVYSLLGQLQKGNIGPVDEACDVALDSLGNIYVATGGNIHYVTKFDSNFNQKWTSPELQTVQGIAVSPITKHCWVVSNESDSVEDLDPNTGNILSTLKPNPAFGVDYDTPYNNVRIAFDSQGLLYLTDQFNSKVCVYNTSNPAPVRSWSTDYPGEVATSRPSPVTLDSFGFVYVADQANNVVLKFDASGNLITKFGGTGSGSGQFVYPTGICVDSNGFVYVLDNNNARAVVFAP